MRLHDENGNDGFSWCLEEAIDVARSAPREVHYHADVAYMRVRDIRASRTTL